MNDGLADSQNDPLARQQMFSRAGFYIRMACGAAILGISIFNLVSRALHG